MISSVLITALLIGLAQANEAAAVAAPVPWGEFSRIPARGISPIKIVIGTVAQPPGVPPIYWASRTGRMEKGQIDSVQCPALARVVRSLRRIDLPALVPGAPGLLIGDGTAYSLTVHSSYNPPHSSNLDTITITSAHGPLADWIERSLNSLEACWPRS